MPLLMDRHYKVGFTGEEICVAHEKDLEIQGVSPSRVSTTPAPSTASFLITQATHD